MPIAKLLNGDLIEIESTLCIKFKDELFAKLETPPRGINMFDIRDPDVELSKNLPDNTVLEDKMYYVFIKHMYIMEWVDESKLDMYYVSKIPEAVPYLKDHPSKIDWVGLSGNPSPDALEMLKENPSQINWHLLCSNTNPDAIQFLYEQMTREDGLYPYRVENPYFEYSNHFPHAGLIYIKNGLSANPVATWILKIIPMYILWGALCYNPSKEAIELLEENMDLCKSSLDWGALCNNPSAIYLIKKNIEDGGKEVYQNRYNLSKNPNAVDILKENPELIYWEGLALNTNPEAVRMVTEYLTKNITQTERNNIIENLSGNPCPEAIKYVEDHLSELNQWCLLSRNPYGVHLLEKNKSKIDYKMLSLNPGIFRV
jgi:hypothetical protein